MIIACREKRAQFAVRDAPLHEKTLTYLTPLTLRGGLRTSSCSRSATLYNYIENLQYITLLL